MSSRNSTEITRRQHFDRHHVASNVVLATVMGVLIEVPLAIGGENRQCHQRVAWRRPGILSYAECCATPDIASSG
ncbi:MAG TPA: hypothetical protein VLB06_01455 [Sulfuricaulis sp.]|nr:hypothetical protein [Sulfuricaulis sp.]